MPQNSVTGEHVLTGGGNDESGALATIANSGTIPSSGLYSSRVTAAAAVTGVIMQPGTYPGQELCVIHEGAAANTITFAAAGTSNVADGVGSVIAGLTAKCFVWDSQTRLWYRES